MDPTPHDLDDLARTLRGRRVELATELARLTEPPEEGSTIGFGKRIGEGTTEAVERIGTTAVAMSVSQSIRDLDLALAKIDEGTWGTCDRCGQPIPLARLEARPTASRCVTCADLP